MPVSLEIKELRPDVAKLLLILFSFLHYFKLNKLPVWETLSIFAQKKVQIWKRNSIIQIISWAVSLKKVRQEKGLSQEALGKYVGLGKSSISKIESGKNNISVDDASVLLEAMGEKLNIYIGDQYPSAETKMKGTIFVTVAACWFAEDKGITKQKAFNYLQKNQGIRFLEENWEIEQTMPREQIIQDLTHICNNHIAKTKKREGRMIVSWDCYNIAFVHKRLLMNS